MTFLEYDISQKLAGIVAGSKTCREERAHDLCIFIHLRPRRLTPDTHVVFQMPFWRRV